MAKKRKYTHKKKASIKSSPKHSLPTGFWAQVGAVSLIAISLLFVVAWFGGGRDMAIQLGGQVTLGVLLIGVVVSAAFAALTNPKDWAPD